jgi:hypothetical protein
MSAAIDEAGFELGSGGGRRRPHALRPLDSQPSAVLVLIHQTERATRLAALKRLGKTVYALCWTAQQCSAFWALWRACRCLAGLNFSFRWPLECCAVRAVCLPEDVGRRGRHMEDGHAPRQTS